MNYDNIKDFRKIYDHHGPYHREARGFKKWFLHDNYYFISKGCTQEDRVLDIACGEGCLGTYLKVNYLAGVDYSQKALKLNKELYPGVYDELYEGDMRNLDKINMGLFNKVICSLSLMYLIGPDLNKCLKDTYNMLMPGGYFIFTYPTVSPYRKANPEAAELTPEEVVDEVKRVNFKIEEVIPICPLLPKSTVEKSEMDEYEKEAYKEYEQAKETMTLLTSYHFLCKAKK